MPVEIAAADFEYKSMDGVLGPARYGQAATGAGSRTDGVDDFDERGPDGTGL